MSHLFSNFCYHNRIFNFMRIICQREGEMSGEGACHGVVVPGRIVGGGMSGYLPRHMNGLGSQCINKS